MANTARPNVAQEDFAISSRRDRVRYMGNIPGRYFLDKWRNRKGRKAPSFACRVQRISSESLTISAPVPGSVGEKVTSYFEDFGVLRGKIIRPLGTGFVMAIKMAEEDREKMVAKVAWHERRKNYEVMDFRQHRRIVPLDPMTNLLTADGRKHSCFVIDMSVSGAAVSADIEVEEGTPLAIGQVVGRVVRLLEVGFAVQFLEEQEPDGLEANLIHRDETAVYM